MSVKSYS